MIHSRFMSECQYGGGVLVLYSFLYQLCGYVMTTLTKDAASERVALLAAQLSVSFVLETLIHAKEKVPTGLLPLELVHRD